MEIGTDNRDILTERSDIYHWRAANLWESNSEDAHGTCLELPICEAWTAVCDLDLQQANSI